MFEQYRGTIGLRQVYPRSVVEERSPGGMSTTYSLARLVTGEKVLCVRGDAEGFEGEPVDSDGESILVCPLTASNARELRARLPWLRPVPLGLQTSAGCGDRLGYATPGHIRAVRTVGGIAPILAQQSMRENARTGRTPQEVMDDAMWGVFEEGWRDPWGADADHLKTTADIDLCVAAGYTFYTIDPGDHVDNAAHTDELAVLREKFNVLPWQQLQDYLGRYACALPRHGRGLAPRAKHLAWSLMRCHCFVLPASMERHSTTRRLCISTWLQPRAESLLSWRSLWMRQRPRRPRWNMLLLPASCHALGSCG